MAGVLLIDSRPLFVVGIDCGEGLVIRTLGTDQTSNNSQL